MSRSRTWDTEKAEELLARGEMSRTEIAKAVGVSVAVLNKYIKTKPKGPETDLSPAKGWVAVSPQATQGNPKEPVENEASVPEVSEPMDKARPLMSVAALAELFTTVVDNFHGAEALVVLESGVPIMGCSASIEYGPDGRPRKVLLTLR